MTQVRVEAYTSSTLVLLAFNWEGGGTRRDFLGFAISRRPGFKGEALSYLPNRLTFDGAAKGPVSSEKNPIQKFEWWDANITDADRGKTFTYTVTPVTGSPASPTLETAESASIDVTLPQAVVGRIGTWFNRAVVSSQAFSNEFGQQMKDGELTGTNLDRALAWLANGLDEVIPSFIQGSSEAISGAIYHLTDEQWTIPALKQYRGNCELVYDSHDVVDSQTGEHNPSPNATAVGELPRIQFYPRDKTHIMHDKFLVRLESGSPSAVLMGSANFTTEGIATQANLLHTWNSPELAKLYLDRAKLLQHNLTIGQTARQAGWSEPIVVDEAMVHVFFPPEPKGSRTSIDAIVDAVKEARSSVVFCMFDPTDKALLDAIFAVGDDKKMMFGLINHLPKAEPNPRRPNAATDAAVTLYHRSREGDDIAAQDLFGKGSGPEGFVWEVANLPGHGGKFPVYIHHKFIVIDGETDSPTIFTGSANMSKNSVEGNDENLLEITKSQRLGRLYLAEFMRLYEHYRARQQWNVSGAKKGKGLALAKDNSWAKKYFDKKRPEYNSRLAMSGSSGNQE